jgi:hypothetical protein
MALNNSEANACSSPISFNPDKLLLRGAREDLSLITRLFRDLEKYLNKINELKDTNEQWRRENARAKERIAQLRIQLKKYQLASKDTSRRNKKAKRVSRKSSRRK